MTFCFVQGAIVTSGTTGAFPKIKKMKEITVKLLEQFIAQTGKQPADWTSHDIQKYLEYVKEQVTEPPVVKKYDN